VTPPNTKTKTIKVKIGPPDGRTATDQGDPYTVKVPNFKKQCPALDKNGKPDPSAKVEDYSIEAFFDKELGPDLFKGKIDVV
jgi:hypothetical protein